ncbi:MAG: hypothetical protein WBG62_06325, partial [Cyclobacteriaceae bacterium]
FSNLIALAKVDGHFHESEEALIYVLGKRYSLRDKQIREIIEESSPAEATIPIDRLDQLDQLRDLVNLMLADGRVDEREMVFCQEIASNYGFKNKVIEELIGLVEEEPFSGSTWKENRDYLLKMNG